MTVSRKEQLAQRITAFSTVCNMTIDSIDASEPWQLDIRFVEGAVLTLALDDPCGGTRATMREGIGAGEVLLDISPVHFNSTIHNGEKKDIIRIRLLTSTGSKTVDFYNDHAPTCTRFSLRYKVTLCGEVTERKGSF